MNGEQLTPDEQWAVNNAETMQRRVARRTIFLEGVMDHMRAAREPQFARQLAEAIGITVKQASPLLRELERAGRLTSQMVPMVNCAGAGRRYFQIPEGS